MEKKKPEKQTSSLPKNYREMSDQERQAWAATTAETLLENLKKDLGKK